MHICIYVGRHVFVHLGRHAWASVMSMFGYKYTYFRHTYVCNHGYK